MLIPKPHPLSMALTAAVFFASLPAQAITISSFNLANVDVDFLAAGDINFDADFAFDDFDIVGQTGGTGDLLGLFGEIDGTFTFDTLGSVATAGGTFSIDDGLGDSTGDDDILTGTLDFKTINFVTSQASQVVSLGGTLTFDPSYIGDNGDLLTLTASGIEYQIFTDFFFAGLTTLDALFADGDTGGTLIGSTATVTVPEPHSLALLGMGLVGLGVWTRRRRKGQPNHNKRSMKPNSSAYGSELAF